MSLTSVILGKIALPLNKAYAEGMASALNAANHTVLEAGDGQNHGPTGSQLDHVLRELSRRQQRATVLAFANGTSLMSGRHYNMQGEDDGLQMFMERVIKCGEAAPDKPLDVFVRMAGRPRTLRKYANRLPQGSLLAALRMDTYEPENAAFWQMAGNYALQRSNSQPARAMLRWALMHGEDNVIGMPLVAVSGCQPVRPQQIWTAFSNLDSLPEATHDTFSNDMIALDSANARNLSHSLNTCLPYNSVFELSPLNYALALESLWDRFFAPAVKQDAATPAARQHKAEPVSGQTSGSAGISSQPTRLSLSELASLPKKLRRVVGQDPRLARQLGLKR